MTLVQLREEAKKHGYKLQKEYPDTTLIPCICGKKHFIRLFTYQGKYYKCVECGFTAEAVKYQYQAKLKWNECVERAKKQKMESGKNESKGYT